MRMMARLVIAAACSAILVGPAAAAEMSAAEIKELISGKSVYLELATTAASGVGQGVIYYNADGTALFRTAKGPIWHGTWSIKDNTVCIDWKELPNNPCTKYDKQGEVITIINVATGQARGKVMKTAPGNAENLVP
jgi:hypothetical protein